MSQKDENDNESSSLSSSSIHNNTKKKRKLESTIDDKTNEPLKKKVRKLPSLKSISNVFNNNNKNKNDLEQKLNDNNLSKYQGKHRRYAHQKGNWSVHIYIPIHSNFKFLFDNLFNIIKNNQNDNNNNKIHKMEEFHISLSICQPIRTHQISYFVDSITKLINNSNKQSFNITFNKLKYFKNENENRHFGSLLVDYNNHHIINLINIINNGMIQWGLQKYYDNPKPHVSFIWSLNEFKYNSQTQTKINLAIEKELNTNNINIKVDTIVIKIGNRLYSIKLSSN